MWGGVSLVSGIVQASNQALQRCRDFSATDNCLIDDIYISPTFNKADISPTYN